MKKILLATTVLAATTGYAAAEVKTTASVRMGVVSVPSVTAKAAGSTAAADANAVVAAQKAVNNAADTATLATAKTALAAAEKAAAASAAVAAVGSDVAFSSRVRIGFAASGETDNGLTFGASVRADQSGQGNTANGDSTVFISGRCFAKRCTSDSGNWTESESLRLSHCQTRQPIRASWTHIDWNRLLPPSTKISCPVAISFRTCSAD